MIPGISSRRRFSDLSEQEVLALAISSEEDDGRIYRSYAQRVRADYPASAAVFDGMAEEQDTHRKRLIALHQKRFGDVIPLIAFSDERLPNLPDTRTVKELGKDFSY